MMNISVNIDFVYEGIDYAKAIREVKDVGYHRAEIVFMQGKSFELLKALREECGVEYEVMMTDFIPWLDGKREDEFVQAAEKRVEQAKALGCGKVIFFTDDAVEGMPHEEQLARIENCAKRMLPFFEREDVTLLLEPINNKVDHKKCSIWDFDESADILRRVGSPNFKMLFDIYHMQIMHGNVTRTMLQNMELIEHVHCAGNPGRHEIFYGELNYRNILADLEKAGYKGGVGVEYSPVLSPREGLEKTLQLLNG